MPVYQVIGSIGVKSNRSMERAESSHHIPKSSTKHLGYNNAQRARILSIVAEMNKTQY